MLRRFIIAALAACAFTAAFAQDRPPAVNDAAREMIGVWELSNAEHSKQCNVTFKAGRTKLGLRLEFDPACADAFPFVQAVVAWKYPDNDLLYLLDANGKAQIEFSEVEDGMFEAPTPGVGVLLLQTPAAAGRPIDDNEPPPGAGDGG
ncbi:MAG TPA: AprI/Inh family metalloprotease inhibitor [Pseudolabrys sp.]|jgi:hypothetical protein|nr:AprI/Inh family metalloprotease inhibitor [Pseudolabrys sp.]